ncbi:MAG: ATP-binding protein [Actinomycetota bacterium]|nr:ATP-binding protein [Actinomycetota bacterium]
MTDVQRAAHGASPGRARSFLIAFVPGVLGVAATAAFCMTQEDGSGVVAGAIGLAVTAIAAGIAVALNPAGPVVVEVPESDARTTPEASAATTRQAARTPATTRTPATARASAPASAHQHAAEVLTTVGWRTRHLAERQIDSLTAARDELSGMTESLEQADRLALRMRRSGQTLVVLADDDADAEPTEDTTIVELIELAIADNDHRHRIDRESVQPALVSGTAVADIAHLIGELIDNAVTATENGTEIVVVGRRGRNGYTLSVVDEGTGMTEDARAGANGRLRSRASILESGTTSFGLPVVARLADRHGVSVQLLESATDGIIAKVRVPAALLLDEHGEDHEWDDDEELLEDDEAELEVEAVFGEEPAGRTSGLVDLTRGDPTDGAEVDTDADTDEGDAEDADRAPLRSRADADDDDDDLPEGGLARRSRRPTPLPGSEGWTRRGDGSQAIRANLDRFRDTIDRSRAELANEQRDDDA